MEALLPSWLPEAKRGGFEEGSREGLRGVPLLLTLMQYTPSSSGLAVMYSTSEASANTSGRCREAIPAAPSSVAAMARSVSAPGCLSSSLSDLSTATAEASACTLGSSGEGFSAPSAAPPAARRSSAASSALEKIACCSKL